MSVISSSEFIKCSFLPAVERIDDLAENVTEVYFARTSDLETIYDRLKSCISEKEKNRADKFMFDSDRATYITCHAVLRLILSSRTRIGLKDISISHGLYDKPYLEGNGIQFNITHARDSFAIAISGKYEVGIDIELVSRKIDFESIVRRFFSEKERSFIFSPEGEPAERFYLLWTRKEALLKALGTGIADNLPGIEVSAMVNFVERKLFDELIPGAEISDYYIYSEKYLNYYLSIAVPERSSVEINHLKEDDVISFFS